jgi:hypothetical protein
MKRAAPYNVASNPSGNNPPLQANQDDEVRAQNEGNWHNPTMKQKGGKVKPLTPEEMEARLFLTLASKSEIKNKEIHIKIGTPDPTNSELPLDVMNRITSFIPSYKAQLNFALTNRFNYLNFDIKHPLRRFPGLVDDLMRTRHFVQLARLELMQQFDNQIKNGGSYDNVLLTPLSPLTRLSIAIAMLVWVQDHTLTKDKPDCIKLAENRLLTEFTSLKNNPAIKPDELHDMLMMAIRAVLNAPESKTKPHRSLDFGMKIGSKIIRALKSKLPDDTTERVIFFEVLKANPDYETSIDYLKNEASRWPLEHLAVAMMFKATPLLLDRLTELTPSERPAAVTKIIQALLTTHHVESYSHYAENIIRICAMCFTTLSHELTSENSSLIISVLDLLRNCANRLPPKNEEQARNFKEGFDLGDLPNTNQINDLMTDYYLLKSCINTFKGYVFRRMMDWIKVMPDLELAAQITSALSRSFNISVPNTPH